MTWKTDIFIQVPKYSLLTLSFHCVDDWYWKLSNNSIAPEYPKLLSQKWPGLPGKIDAAFTDHKDAYTYFFKGSQYWKFNGEKLEVGFPRLIVKDFLGVPNNLQAASMGNRFIGEVYFFKGNYLLYWSIFKLYALCTILVIQPDL